ncbi:hypothetical protein ES703_106390 [subsurface metagenome]
MGNMQVASGNLGKDYIASHYNLLGGGWHPFEAQLGGYYTFIYLSTLDERCILAVVNNRQTEGSAVVQCLAHKV